MQVKSARSGAARCLPEGFAWPTHWARGRQPHASDNAQVIYDASWGGERLPGERER